MTLQRHTGYADLARLITGGAANLRIEWRNNAQFDDVAVMHITAQGQQMLLQLAAHLGSAGNERLRRTLASPPWTRNDGNADAPLSLLVSLRAVLSGLAGQDEKLSAAAESLIAEMAAVLDSLQRERVRSLDDEIATDSLTGTLSRRAILAALSTECARAGRYGRPLSVIYIDLDSLKQVNDESGHRAGDDLLKTLARTVMTNTRASDSIGRLGGDEFLLLLPETDIAGARSTAEKLESPLAESGVHATLGAAGSPETDARSDALIEAADTAMRAAREAGRQG